MPGGTIGKSLNLGYPGTYSRMSDCVIANRVAKTPIAFGTPVVLNPDNTFSVFGSGNTAADFAGVAVRTVKQQTDIYDTGGIYRTGEPTDVLLQGSVVVEVKNGTPAAGKNVYVRIAENPAVPNSEIGSFEAEDDGDNTVLLGNVKFTTGQMDANGISEITILTRQA